MSCIHSPFGCSICRIVDDGRTYQEVAAGIPALRPQTSPLPENRLTVEILQQMFNAERAEVRRLVEELAKRKHESDRLHEQIAELKRKARRRKK